MWDVEKGHSKKIKPAGKGRVTYAMVFSPTGHRIACNEIARMTNQSTRIRVCSWEPGIEPRYIDQKEILTDPTFSPDGKSLAWGTGFDEVLLKVWNLDSGSRVLSLAGHRDAITSVTFSPDGNQLASASDDQTIKIWHLSTGKEIATLHEEQKAVCLAFSPDGLRLASGSEDGTVKIWAVPRRAVRALLPKGPTLHVAFSPNGQRLVGSGGSLVIGFIESSTVIWNGKTGKELQRALNLHEASRGGNRVEWSPDGRYLAAGSRGEVWDVNTNSRTDALNYLQQNGVSGYGCAFSRDGRLVAATCLGGRVKLWDMAKGRLLRTFWDRSRRSEETTCLAFSPDGRLLASGWALLTAGITPPGVLRVWDVRTGQDVFQFAGIRHGVWKVAFSPDGRRLAAAIGSFGAPGSYPTTGTVKLWDTATWREIATLRGHPAGVWGLAFSPDSQRLATAGGCYSSFVPGEVIIWDTLSWQELITLKDPAAGVFGVAFSPCGRRLGTASRDGTVRIWDGTPLAETPARDAGLAHNGR